MILTYEYILIQHIYIAAQHNETVALTGHLRQQGEYFSMKNRHNARKHLEHAACRVEEMGRSPLFKSTITNHPVGILLTIYTGTDAVDRLTTWNGLVKHADSELNQLLRHHTSQHDSNFTSFRSIPCCRRLENIRSHQNWRQNVIIIIIIIIIQNLSSSVMPLGGYRGAGGTGKSSS